MTIATLGGLLLIIGSIFVFYGQIFKSVMIYFVADLCWVYISYNNNDIQGVVFIIIGMLLGLGAFIKMNNGTFYKTIGEKR